MKWLFQYRPNTGNIMAGALRLFIRIFESSQTELESDETVQKVRQYQVSVLTKFIREYDENKWPRWSPEDRFQALARRIHDPTQITRVLIEADRFMNAFQ